MDLKRLPVAHRSEEHDQPPCESNSRAYCQTCRLKLKSRLRPGWRCCTRRWRPAAGRRGRHPRSCSDLVPDFCNSYLTNFIEHSNDVAVHGLGRCAQRQFNVRISRAAQKAAEAPGLLRSYSLLKNTAFPSSTFTETKSTPVGGGPTAAGKLTRIPFMCVWLKLTIMKLASRKNMMSINGMISMRALFCGTGEDSLILRNLGRRAGHGESDGNVNLGHCSGSKSPLPKRASRGIIQYRIPSA